jgi:hypothetical protein
MENNTEKKEKENSEVSLLFNKERSEWREKIQVLALDLKDIKTVAKAQVDLFGYRQILLEYSYKLAQVVSKLNSRIKKDTASLLRGYTERSDIRYQANEKRVMIEGDLSDLNERLEIIEGHRKFIDQTMQTVDHMLYGIRQRIALEEYLRNSSGSIK